MSEYPGIEEVQEEATAGLVQKGEEYPVTEAEADLEPEPVARLTELVPPQLPDDEDE